MSKLVIIGGHDCMVCKYKEVCKQYDCKAKVFFIVRIIKQMKTNHFFQFIQIYFTDVGIAVLLQIDRKSRIIRSHHSQDTFSLHNRLKTCQLYCLQK